LRTGGCSAVRRPMQLDAIQPDARDKEFNELVESFIAAAYGVLDARKDHEAHVAANANLSRAECRDRVLTYLA